MEQHNYDKQHTLNNLISEYEAMSQKGAVLFYEETVFSKIIEYYENECSIDLALAVVDQALIQHLYSSLLYCKKAELLATQKREADALNAIEQAEVLSPRDYEVKLVKAEVLSLFGDYNYSLSIIEHLKDTCNKQSKKKLADIFFSEGIIFEQMHQYDSMFSSWKQVLRLNPAHEETLDRIWLCVEMSRKFDESIELCNEIIDHDPYCDKAWFNLGHAHTYFGNYKKAIEAYEYAFIINKNFEWAYRHCAELCMETQNYAKALDCYEEVLPIILPDGEILFKIGQCYHALGKSLIAKEFYKRSIRIDDINDEAYFYLGKCAAEVQEWKKAISFYKKAIEIESKREEYCAELAETYRHLGDRNKACYYFEKAIELAPEQAIYWVKFASFLFEINDINAAFELLEDANEHAVGAELLYCKAACLFKIQDKKTAMNVLTEALMENFEMHTELFGYIPSLATDKKIKAMLDFYNYEE